MMKRTLFALLLSGAAYGAVAQEAPADIVPVDKYSVATNRFGANWFVTLGGDYVSSYSNQERGLDLSGNPFKSFRRSWNADVTVGKWFTPSVGVRLKGQGFQLKNIDGRENPSFDMFNLALEGMLNLRNLFGGYKPNHIWDISLHAGTGFYRNLDNKNTAFMYTAGILNTFNLTKRLYVNLDIYGNIALNDLDLGQGNPTSSSNFFTCRDRQLGISLGLGVNLGKVGWSKTPDLAAINAMHKAQTEALNATLAEQQSENQKLKELLAKQQNTKPETETTVREVLVDAPVSVFFNLNSSRIASKKDLVNVKALVDYAKKNGKTIEVIGFADSKTGTAKYNEQLSRKRAETVAKELVSMGMSENMIKVEAKGGVADLDPASYNRRVLVHVVD